MNLLKPTLILLILSASVVAFAQSGYDIQQTTVTEAFNSDDELQSRNIIANGVRDKEALNIDLTVDSKNTVQALRINDQIISPELFAAFKSLTDYVILYVDEEATAGTTTAATTTTSSAGITAKYDKAALVDIIKTALINDQLIDNPKVFDFMLTHDSLYINAKKQEQVVFERYKRLHDAHTNMPLQQSTYFQITQTL